MNQNNNLQQDILFDPENLSFKIDPSEIFKGEEYVYLLSQSIIKSCYHFKDNIVIRAIDKIDFIPEEQLVYKSRTWKDILSEVDDVNIKLYPEKKIYFKINELEEDFLKIITDEGLFNHEKMKKFIGNYSDIFWG